jgi:hypothetical protein
VLWLVFRGGGTSWAQLADIGETYGAVSAILSALAVGGVAASLLYQSQQLRLSRLHHVRSVQRELMMKLVDRPDLANATNYFGDTTADRGQRAFIVSLVQYIFLAYEAGLVTDASLTEEVFPALFGSEAGRHFWREHRLDWIRPGGEAGARAFGLVVDEAWRQAEAQANDVAAPRPNVSAPQRATAASVIAVSAVVASASLGWWLGRRAARR